MVSEDLERNWVVVFPLFVLVEEEVDELGDSQRTSRNGMALVFAQEGDDVDNVKDASVGGGYGILEGLEREGTVIEREPGERGLLVLLFASPLELMLRVGQIQLILAVAMFAHLK